MQQLIYKLLIISCFALLTSCGATQKLSKEKMEARIAALEDENAALKKDMEVMKSQVRVLINSLPKPGQDARPGGGGARPQNWNGGSTSQVDPNATTMEFEKTIHDFGTLKDGASVSYTFKFKNTGNKPLLISNAKGSCGCTVPKWPREAIAPGASGEIQVTFNSKGKKGKQHKSVTLTANTDPANTRLYIKADVGT
ncbi:MULTISPECIES: DUF1573 domain-containing protein [unclassified Aureispira]|uniref:DUF1573 domain-containing protein n=1 Tax=unclassified Aureispira TaxID=2649989 RepID=UPI0006963DC4|nr:MULTISPECIES: DUF1573 domain-containing protein [unclassified Aureispira]WMX13809.1 DUF1573 domain-containing protein [Aureispira sp. CCB-E]